MVVLRKLALVAALSSCVGIAATMSNVGNGARDDETVGRITANHLRSLQTTTKTSTTTPILFHDEDLHPTIKNAIPLTADTSNTSNGYKTKLDLHPNNMADDTRTRTFTSSSIVVEGGDGDSGVSPLSPPTIKKRYVVKCAGSLVKCEEDILSTSGESVKIVNPMHNTDMFAVEMYEEQIYEVSLKNHVDHVEDDPLRFLLHPRHYDYISEGEVEEETMMQKNTNHNLLRRRELLQNTAYGIDNVNAPAVWEAYAAVVGDSPAKGSRAKVCILDTGLRSTHTDLDVARLSGSNLGGLTWDTDVQGHGSHVAGIIGASDNTEGVVGVAPETNLYVVRVFNRLGIFASDLVAAMEECAQNGAKVISMSLGGPERSNSEEFAMQQLFDRGILLVAASGNSGDTGNPVEYPAAYGSVISVGATDEGRNIASFSSFNDQLSLVAPGVNIRSLGARNDNDYESLSGTSMACPHVAGVAALLFSIFDTATSQQVRDALEKSALGLAQCGQNAKFGYGHVDAKAAADLLQSGGTPAPVTCNSAVVTITPDNYGSETTWQIANANGVPIAGGGPYSDSSTMSEVTALNLPELPSGECYQFTIFDTRDDGLCCQYGQGSYGLTFKGVEVTSSSTFSGSQETTEFGCDNGSSNSPPTTPSPTIPSSPTFAPPTPSPANPSSPTSPVCGNGVVEAGEECDDGNFDDTDACSNLCMINSGTSTPVCGNGILESGEECDDGNFSDGDACTNACKNNVCGDGLVWEGVEACDDGNADDGDSCRNDCTAADKADCAGDSIWEQWWNDLLGNC